MRAAAAALAALAVPALMLAPVAQAGPNGCEWSAAGNHSVFHQDNNLDIQIDWGPHASGGRASFAGAQGFNWSGSFSGGVNQGNGSITFTVPWHSDQPGAPSPPTNTYTGQINGLGGASGSTVNLQGVKNGWVDQSTWTCASTGFAPNGPAGTPEAPLPPLPPDQQPH